MKAIVSGANGFIGIHTIHEFSKRSGARTNSENLGTIRNSYESWDDKPKVLK